MGEISTLVFFSDIELCHVCKKTCLQRRSTRTDPNQAAEPQKLATVKFLNFGTPEIFAVIYLKFKQRGQTLRVFCQNGANGIANSEDLDQTAPLGAV